MSFSPAALIELVWRDETGTTAETVLHISSALDHHVIADAAEAVSAIMAPLTGAVLVRYRIKYQWLPDERLAPAGDTRITSCGMFFFSAGPSAIDGAIVVHSLKPDVLAVDGPLAGVGINLADSRVIDLASAVIDNGITNQFADVYVSLFAAYMQSRV